MRRHKNKEAVITKRRLTGCYIIIYSTRKLRKVHGGKF